MKQVWTSNQEEILHELSFLVNKKVAVSLRFAEQPAFAATFLRIEEHKGEPHLVLANPPGLHGKHGELTVQYELDGVPAIGFVCRIRKRTGKLLATRLPVEMFLLEQ